MHIRKDQSFVVTNKISAPEGGKLGIITPLLSSSLSWVDNSCISAGASRYGVLAMGVAPGISRFGTRLDVREGILEDLRGRIS